MYLINLKYTKEVAAYDSLGADDVSDAWSSAALHGRARVHPFRTCVSVTTRLPTDGRLAKEGARQEGAGFEGVYVLDLSLLKASKLCGYPFKNQETTMAGNKKSKQVIKHEWVTTKGGGTRPALKV
jgi:hypothetical protein